jgi:phage gp36-like protein
MAKTFTTTAASGSQSGRYATQADMEDVFGAANVLAWSDTAGAGVADAGRISRALAHADQTIDDMFRGGPYSLPLSGGSGVPAKVTEWAAKLAGVWLYEARGLRDTDGNRLADMAEAVKTEIRSYLTGPRRLLATRHANTPEAPVVIL